MSDRQARDDLEPGKGQPEAPSSPSAEKAELSREERCPVVVQPISADGHFQNGEDDPLRRSPASLIESATTAMGSTASLRDDTVVRTTFSLAPAPAPAARAAFVPGTLYLPFANLRRAIAKMEGKGRFQISVELNAESIQQFLDSFGVHLRFQGEAVSFPAPMATNVEIEVRPLGANSRLSSLARDDAERQRHRMVIADFRREADRIFADATSEEFIVVREAERLSPHSTRSVVRRVPRPSRITKGP